MKSNKIILFSLLFLVINLSANSQSPAFYHLSTAEGLSDNNVRSVARDKNGVLWIATSEGLNSFDGNRINTYTTYQYPLLASNSIEKIIIDNDNNVWVGTISNYVNKLDEKRRIQRYLVGDTSDKTTISILVYVPAKGILALKGRQHYWLTKNTPDKFVKTAMPFDSVLIGSGGFSYFTENNLGIFYRNEKLIVIDYITNKVLFHLAIPGLNGAYNINKDELIAYTSKGDVFYRISISQQKIIKEYRNIKDQHNLPINGRLRNIDRIDENRFVLSSYFSGLYILNLQKETAQHWEHDPIDHQSIGSNNIFAVKYDTSGYLFATSLTSGLHFYNIKQEQASNKSYFIDANKQIFDGYIQTVFTDKQSNIWMGAQDRLIMWNRNSDKTIYVPCILRDGTNISGNETIRVVNKDDEGKLWVGTSRYGILVLNDKFKTIAQITDSAQGKRTGLQSQSINAICRDKDGYNWIGTFRGICYIDNKTFKITTLQNHKVLDPLSTVPCETIWIDEAGNVWFGTSRGLWCFDKVKNTLINYNEKDGLPNSLIYDINQDKLGNIYIASGGGLSILSTDGKITNYDRGNGLRNDRCEAVLRDNDGYMWIGNLNCIIRYDPISKSFAVFEEGLGFSHAGFRMRYGHKNEAGEMFWGTDKGLTYFFPRQMTNTLLPLYPSINEVQTDNGVFRFTAEETLKFPFTTSSIVFSFSSGELGGSKKIQFRYQLEGFDDEWKKPVTNGQVVYSNLPPGQYTFFIKASRNGSTWFESSYPISINITPPWWKQVWFRLLMLLFIVGVIWVTIRYFQNKRKTNDIEKMISYFANSGYTHSSVDDILWDISRNCIARLGFENCVIYMLDEENKKLIQKATYESKNADPFKVSHPLSIQVGKGIAGDVALTGKSSIVADTSKDHRYIMNDRKQYSELTVPIIHEGEVIGIIDSENKKKNFFTQQHLKALETISSICATKISGAMANEAMEKSKLELMELNVKMAESKFLNLRLQMNPHFLFNSLSSIQHLIVSQQSNKAYKYLTIFSNFLRSLLNFAEKNFITLDDEITILKMYIELESLRFDESFNYEILVDETLNNDIVYVPSLMVQPFVENAIWHGLLHKEGDKKLTIRFSGNAEDSLVCEIEDNGIGREQAAAIGKNKMSSMIHQSKGISIIKERLGLLQQKTGKPATLVIKDIINGGTKVIITIPYYNPEEI
ncbi:MAG: histidine kinase [Chitinophagaceae bacterium]|nr:histidine kinase [Chitinophagaceae bacterium]